MKSLVDLERIPENFSSEQSLKLQQQAKKGKNGNVLHLYAYRQNKTKLKRMLSEQKYEINKKDKMGNTPLHIACFTGGPKIFKALLKHGADIQATNKNKETPLDLAMLSNYDKIKKKLVEINAPHNTDISKLQMHIIRGENSQALEMINDPKHRGLITRADKLGNLPIHEAACYGMKDCLLALLQHNSPVDPINIDKRTPFYLSCLNSQLECAKLLADHGADLQKRNIYGTQAIHTAVSKQCKDDNILAFLLQKNVDPDSRDGEGMTPLHLATNPERVKMLLHFHADFNTLDSFEFLPVQYMARKGAFFSLQVLVEHGAQIISGEMGFPPAHLAARKGHHKCLDYILQIAKKRDQMFDVCDGWFFENSLIAMTVINNHPKCLRVVLGHSDPGIVSAPEAKKTNFIYLAMKHNRAECANILIESGYPKPPLSKKEINKLSAEFRYLLLGDFSFSKDFEWLFTSGSFFSDLSVVVNDQTEFYLHSFVLHARLGKPAIPTLLQLCKDAHPRVVFHLLFFIYTGVLSQSKISRKKIKKLKLIAHKLSFSRLIMAIKNNTFFDVDNLRQSFLRLLQDPNDSTKNFSITVEKKSLKKTIRVHRCVLAARSQLYRGMLINVNDPSNTAPDLSGRSFDAVFQLVHFLYSDTLSTKSKSVAKELFDAHMYYGLTSDTAVLNESYRVCGKKLIYSTKNLELREKDD